MYEAFYGLRARPFGKSPDPAFLYEGARHGEALARLEMAAADKDIALLTGDIGAGKTTLSRALVDRLDESFVVVLVVNPRLNAAQMLAFVAERLGVEPVPKSKAKLVDALTAQLFALYEQGKKPLVIVDEAHLITQKAVFEELRLLTNLQLDDEQLVGLLVIGQPELRKTLEKKALASFTQRIGVAYHLGPLDADETAAYVVHRLLIAGRDENAPPLFTDDALFAIYEKSGGVPRRINTLCQGALLAGFSVAAKRIGADIVDDVHRDFSEHMGRMWSSGTSAATSAAIGRDQGESGAEP